jgi:nicotinate-nucleotide adenylyltransferase
MNIGIFGGTFNPPHLGHLIVAERVRSMLSLDMIYFVPSFISPHKKRGEETLASHRLKMVRLAIRKNSSFACSNLEIKQKDTSYTYRTIESFHKTFPSSRLFILIGADNFAEFSTWKHPDRICDKATLVVMSRPAHAPAAGTQFAAVAKFLDVPDVEISSTQIRKRIKQGKSIRYLVPEVVHRYIMEHGIYR